MKKVLGLLLIIFFFFFLSLPWWVGSLGDESFYEIKLNDDVSILYFSDDGRFYGHYIQLYPSPVELYSSSDKWPEKYKSVKLGGEPRRKRLELWCKKVIYNDTIVLCALMDSKYCQYKVILEDKKKVLQRIELTVEEFESLALEYKDCDYYDVEKLETIK